nr:PAS domain-containing protein [uncultured Celeribacter sp.]
MMGREDCHGKKIVSFLSHQTYSDFPMLRLVETYWDGLRRGRPVPARAEIDPRGIRDALDHTFVLERVASGAARFRLAGHHLNGLAERDVRGAMLSSLFSAPSAKRLSQTVAHVCEQPLVAILSLTCKATQRRAALLLCPLKSDLGDVTRILGCLQANGTATPDTPVRFEISHISTRSLTDADTTDQITTQVTDLTTDAAARNRPAARPPQLRVVTDTTPPED